VQLPDGIGHRIEARSVERGPLAAHAGRIELQDAVEADLAGPACPSGCGAYSSVATPVKSASIYSRTG